MTFESPWVFWFLLALPGVGWVLWISFERGKKDLQKVAGAWRGHRISLVYLLKTFFSGTALLSALVLLILALSGPSWGSEPSEEGSLGLDVALAVDVSRSMLCDDVKPSRLARAVEAMRFLASNLPGARFSLTIFKGRGETQLPLTQDINALNLFLDHLSPDLSTTAGTAMADGLKQAASTLVSSSNRNQVVLLVSDGENKDGDPGQQARALGLKNITLFTLGFGTSEGSKISLANGEVVKDLFGRPVISRLDRGLLESLAKEGRGAFFLGNDSPSVSDLLARLNSLSSSSDRGGIKLQTVGRYRIFLLLALTAFGLFIGIRVFKWQRVF